MKHLILGTLLGATLAIPATAQSAGDASVGESDFRKCKACHMITSPDGEEIVRGGRTGPNLWGIVGRKIASYDGFKYGAGITKLAEMNPDMVWTEENLAAYLTNPNDWLKEQTGDNGARSKMTFRLNSNQADMAAYLASVSPDAAQ